MDITFEQLPKTIKDIFEKVTIIERLLLEKSKEIQSEGEDLLTVQQAAAFLTLSVPTIYGLVQRAEIPVNKGKKRLYFSRQELLAWVKAGRRKTMSEIEKEAMELVNGSKNKRG